MTKEIVEAVGVLEREKGISADRLMTALEDALLSAYKKTPGAAQYARVEVDRGSGDFRVYELLLPPELEEQLLPYYKQAGEEGLFTQDCGGEAAAREDFEFYSAAGQLEGDPADLQVEDFWSLDQLEGAVSSVKESGS